MAGHEVHVATSAIPNVPRTEVRAGVHIHRFALAGNSVVGMAGAEAGYVDFVRTTAWDIIAMHCAQVWSTDALLSWLPSLTCPKVFVAHGLSAYHNPAYREYYARFADSLRNVDAMVSLARGLEDDDFCRDFGLSAPTVIPNGVDSAELGDGAGPPREDGQKSGPLVICLSNHNPNKGHERFFAVVRHMHREHPGASGTLMGGTYRAAKWRLGRLGILGGCAYQCWARSIVSPMIDLRASAPRPQIMELIHAADVML